MESIRKAYAEQMKCAEQIGMIVALRLDAALTEGEIAYLALHIARMVADVGLHDQDAAQI